jgi:hypothetical protein
LNREVGCAAVALVMAGSVACDEIVHVRNLGPEVAVVGLCLEDGRLNVVVDVADPEEDPVDLALSVGGQPLAIAPTGDGAYGLVAGRAVPGERHFVVWALEDTAPASCASDSATAPCRAGFAPVCPTLDDPDRKTGCAFAPASDLPGEVTLRVESRDVRGAEGAAADGASTVEPSCRALMRSP